MSAALLLAIAASGVISSEPSADLSSVGLYEPMGSEFAQLTPVSTLSDLAADFEPVLYKPAGWRHFLELNGATYRKADRADGGGRAALDRFGAVYRAQRSSGDGHIWELGLGYDSLSYDIDFNLASLPLEVSDADYWRASTSYHYRTPGRFSWFAGARAVAGAARDVAAWETINLGASLGLEWRVLDELDFMLVYDGYDRPEESFRGVLLPLIDWQINDELRLGPVAGGYGLDLEWDYQTHYFLSGSYDERAIRLDDDVAPGDWVLRDSERSVQAGMIWSPKEAVELVLQAGLVERDLVVASEGEQLDRVGLDPEAFLGVRLIFGRGSIF